MSLAWDRWLTPESRMKRSVHAVVVARAASVRSVSGIARRTSVTRASAALLQADCAWYGVPTGQFLMRAEASPKSKLSTAVSPASEKTVSAAKVRK